MKFFKILLGTLISASSVSASGAEFGVGIGLSDYSGTIFLPIKTKSNLVVEPFFRYWSNFHEDKNSSDGDIDGYKYSYSTIGLGLFKQRQLPESFTSNYGLRFGYVKESYKDLDNVNNDQDSNKEVLEGYMLSPAISFGYTFQQKLEFSLEAAYIFEKTFDEHNGSDIEEQNTYFDTSFLARYYF